MIIHKDCYGTRADVYVIDESPLFIISEDETWKVDKHAYHYGLTIEYSCLDLSEPTNKEEKND